MAADPSQTPDPNEAAASEGRFAGKVALVTGSSDRGIGGAVAERLVREGAAVALISRTEPKRLLKQLRRVTPQVAWHSCDITVTDNVNQAVADSVAQFGKIDILVNNAGVEIARPIENFSDQQWQDVLEVNLHGAVRVSRAVLPHLSEPGGVIVNVASALALGGCPSFSVYSASKAGLIGFTQSLAWELSPRRIRVVCIAPALVVTPMTFKHVGHLNEETQAKIDACHPLGTGSPHDVASAVAFLASGDASWITGITLPLGWMPHLPLPVDQFMQ